MKFLKTTIAALIAVVALIGLGQFAWTQGQIVVTTVLGTDLFNFQRGPVFTAVSATNLVAFTLNGNNTFSGSQTFSKAIAPTGGIAAANSSAGANTLSPRLFSTCGVTNTGGTSTANGASTNSWIAELYIPANVSTTGAAVYQVGTINGNDTIYLADASGNQILHTASTAAAGASAYQLIPWTATPTTLTGPGTYYIVVQNSGTSNTFGMIPGPATCGVVKRTSDTYGSFPTFTPPTTFTATNVGPIVSLY